MIPRNVVLLVLAVGLVLAATSADALGQYNPYFRPGGSTYGPQPPVSPYLNLLRGNNAAVNYYLGVRPEFERRMFQQRLLLDEERRQVPTDDLQPELFPKLAGTGHPSAFMNYGSYYNLGVTSGVQQPFPNSRRPGR